MQSLRPVVVAISGGVDSAVALLRLVREKRDVNGLFMRNWDLKDEVGEGCTSERDLAYAQQVCDRLRVPLHTVDFTKDYWNEVFLEMLEGFKSGCTPNPDVLCNKHIKFGSLLNHVETYFGQDHLIATGHYARTSDLSTHPVRLRMPLDRSKDQTLFLSQVKQRSLQKTLFPVGDTLKKNVRKEAVESGLGFVERKSESYGVCFIGERHFSSFLREYLPEKKGDVLDFETGEVIGSHNGVHFTTIGQHFALSGHSNPHVKKMKERAAFYVATKDASNNTLSVVFGSQHPALFHDSLRVNKFHWITESPPSELTETGTFECRTRFQNLGRLIACKVTTLQTGGFEIVLDRPERAVTPGQYCVLYMKSECLGSGQITQSFSLYDSIRRNNNSNFRH